MKNWSFIGVAAMVLLPVLANAAKPSSPISLVIAPLSAISAGSEASFKVIAHSQIALDKLVIHIHPLGGVQWSKGEQRWNGPLQPGVPKIVEFSIIVPARGGFELHAIASVQGKSGGGFGARAVYTYDGVVEQKAKPKERKGTRQGKETIEMPVK